MARAGRGRSRSVEGDHDLGQVQVAAVLHALLEHLHVQGRLVSEGRDVDVLEVRVGDVITFKHETSHLPTTHRVVEIASEDGKHVFTTKGDANEAVDPQPLVASGGRMPRVVGYVPLAGYALPVLEGPAGIGLFVALPVAGLLFDRERRRTSRRKRREADPVEAPEQVVPPTVAEPVVQSPVPAVLPPVAQPEIAVVPPVVHPEIAVRCGR